MKEKKGKRILRGREAGIMLEDLDSKLDLIIEKVEGSEERLTARMDLMEVRLDIIESEIIGIRVLLGDHDAAIKRHDHEIVTLQSRNL